MKIKLNISSFRILFLNFIFLPPAFIASMDACLNISKILAFLRYFVSLYVIMRVLLFKKDRALLRNFYFILYSFAIFTQVISMIFNSTVYFTAVMSCISFIGIVIITVFEFKNNKFEFYRITRHYLWLCVLLHFVTLILFPDGLVKGLTGDARIYFMGTKNTITMYILLLMLVSFCQKTGLRKQYNWIELLILFLIVLVNKSSTAFMVVFSIISFVFLSDLLAGTKKLKSIIQKIIILFGCLIGIWFLVSVVLKNSGDGNTMNIITEMLGKEVTFSGRRAIWLRAIEYIIENPLWGNGNNVSYNVWENGIIVHSAHNTFLDYAVKYGCFSLIIILICLIYVFYTIFLKLLHNKKNQDIIYICIIGIGVFGASMFEAIENYYATWIIITSIYLIVNERADIVLIRDNTNY